MGASDVPARILPRKLDVTAARGAGHFPRGGRLIQSLPSPKPNQTEPTAQKQVSYGQLSRDAHRASGNSKSVRESCKIAAQVSAAAPEQAKPIDSQVRGHPSYAQNPQFAFFSEQTGQRHKEKGPRTDPEQRPDRHHENRIVRIPQVCRGQVADHQRRGGCQKNDGAWIKEKSFCFDLHHGSDTNLRIWVSCSFTEATAINRSPCPSPAWRAVMTGTPAKSAASRNSISRARPFPW